MDFRGAAKRRVTDTARCGGGMLCRWEEREEVRERGKRKKSKAGPGCTRSARLRDRRGPAASIFGPTPEMQ